MILCIKTADGIAEIILYKDGIIAQDNWQADREMAKGLLARIESLILKQDSSWDDVKGIIVYKGHGSFTGLRIGLTTANVIAYSLRLPVVGVDGDTWVKDGVANLDNNQDDQMVLPEYGALPRITNPRK